MNGREAVKALMDGKRVRRHTHVVGYYVDFDAIVSGGCQWTLAGIASDDRGDWSVAEDRLTDEELIAEWEGLSKANLAHGNDAAYYIANAFLSCARQLRDRKL